jgi:hypothetical protein
MIKMKAEIKRPTRSVRQLFNYRLPLLLTYKAPRIYGWLFWNFHVIEPTTVETHSYCETWTDTPEKIFYHIRKLTSIGKKMDGGSDTPSLCGLVMNWDKAPLVTNNPPTGCVCLACQGVWENGATS